MPTQPARKYKSKNDGAGRPQYRSKSYECDSNGTSKAAHRQAVAAPFISTCQAAELGPSNSNSMVYGTLTLRHASKKRSTRMSIKASLIVTGSSFCA